MIATPARVALTSPPRLPLALWIGLCVVGGSLIGVLSNSGDSAWFLGLEKPAWNPPSWLFAPVWTALYTLMGIAAWRIWRHGGWADQGPALTLFVAQLVANFAWSPLFFGLQQPALALADIALLWLLIAATIWTFRPIDRLAAWLLVPYLAWVSFASALNAAIVALN